MRQRAMRVSGVLLATVCTTAVAATPDADLLSDPFFERYEPEVQVSGHVIAGVMTATAAGALVADRLVVTTDQPPGTSVCLSVVSRDGIYFSQNGYRLPGQADTVRLPYRSNHADVVRDYDESSLAISARAGDCEAPSSTYLVVRAADVAADKAEPLVVLVNSFGATDVFVQVAGEPSIACDYIAEGRRTTYDFVCRIDGVSPPLDLEILRERFGREQPTVTLSIR